METLGPWSRLCSANGLARTRRVSFIVALAALVVLVGCYAPTDGPDTGGIELVARVPVSLSEVAGTEAELTARSTTGFIFAAVVDTLLIARYRTQMQDVYNRLIVDAVFSAGIFPGLTRPNIYSELGFELPPLEIARADFRGRARSVARSTAAGSGTLTLEQLPAGRDYLVVMEAFSSDGNGAWASNIDLAETQVIAGRSRTVELNLQPERAVLYNAFARTYGVPVLHVYQAGGTWTGNAVEIDPAGVVLEYLGFIGGRYRHHLTFFEPGLSIFPERVYDPNLPTGGRVDIRPGGALEYIITSDEPLLFEWPASLNVAEADLERGFTWLGGTSRYNSKLD